MIFSYHEIHTMALILVSCGGGAVVRTSSNIKRNQKVLEVLQKRCVEHDSVAQKRQVNVKNK